MSNDQPFAFEVDAVEDGEGTRFAVTAAGATRSYHVERGDPGDYSAFFADLARDFGTRVPHLYHEPPEAEPGAPEWRPLLIENRGAGILSGYGDPAVLKTDEGYVLVATSNDARRVRSPTPGGRCNAGPVSSTSIRWRTTIPRSASGCYTGDRDSSRSRSRSFPPTACRSRQAARRSTSYTR